MKSLEIARRLSELGELDKAKDAYILAIAENDTADPMIDFEASLFLLLTKTDTKIAYSKLISLHKNGYFRNEIIQTFIENCYTTAITEIAGRYQKNRNAIERYKYTFSSKNEFIPLDDLRLRFFPVDENGYVPYDVETGEFLDYVNVNKQIISRNFFKDLDNPIFAENVYSQYELEYLNDNVRKSEWCGKENHIYLYYSSFEEFCAWAQVLDFASLLSDKKIVLLLGEGQDKLYPIDFNTEFGIDYSTYSIKPFGVEEIKKIIWHTQLSSHNGGDFFNEIFDSHPNLIMKHSVLLSDVCALLERGRKLQKNKNKLNIAKAMSRNKISNNSDLAFHLLSSCNGKGTDKDILVSYYLAEAELGNLLDRSARIAPALFFQPHFYNIRYNMQINPNNGCVTMSSEEYEEIKSLQFFSEFRYIKTFTPIRRITTSYAATVRFAINRPVKATAMHNWAAGSNMLGDRILNQSYYANPEDRLFADSRIVRFEDGKLNPKATFTRLAEFLDLPYTQSMTYCSNGEEINPEMMPGNARGFDTATVYKKYEEYADDTERYLIEYFMQSAMQAYNYENHYYDGGAPTFDEIIEKIKEPKKSRPILTKQMVDDFKSGKVESVLEFDEEKRIDTAETLDEKFLEQHTNYNCSLVKLLLAKKQFVCPSGRPLELMKLLEPDPELLETELYR